MIWYAAMFLKLLLTALVIAGAMLTLRMRHRRQQNVVPSLPPAGIQRDMAPMIKLIAAGLAVLMLAGSTFYLYHQWQDSYQVVNIRVIDTRTGKTVLYKAYKGDVEGRSFLTIDGRNVTLAEVERLEMGGK